MSTRDRRIVVAATGDDTAARLQARALLMSGCEVVFVGGYQNIEQLAATVRAEDAGALLVDAGATTRGALAGLLNDWELGHVQVEGCEQPDAPPEAEDG